MDEVPGKFLDSSPQNHRRVLAMPFLISVLCIPTKTVYKFFYANFNFNFLEESKTPFELYHGSLRVDATLKLRSPMASGVNQDVKE